MAGNRILARKTLLQMKLEATYGTFLAPAAEDVMWAENIDIQPMVTEQEKDANICGLLGSERTIHFNEYSTVEFDFAMRGAGVAGDLPHYTPIMKAGSRAVTQTAGVKVEFTNLDEGVDSASIVVHHEGNRYPFAGVRGVITWNVSDGKKGMFKFKGIGLHMPATNTAFPAVACDSLANFPPLILNSNATWNYFGQTDLILLNMSISYGADAVYEDHVNQKEVVVDDRAITGSLEFKTVTITQKDWNVGLLAGTTGSSALQLGATDGQIVEINWGSVQINKNDPSGTNNNNRTNKHDVAVLAVSGASDETIVVR